MAVSYAPEGGNSTQLYAFITHEFQKMRKMEAHMIVDTFNRIWQNIYLRVALLAALVYLGFIVLQTTRVAWVSFLVSFLIAYLVEPIVDRLEKSRLIPRWLSIAITITLILVFFVVGGILVGTIVAQISELAKDVRPFLETLPANVEKITPVWMLPLLGDSTENVQAFIREQQDSLLFWLQNQRRQVFSIRSVEVFFGGLGQSVVILFLSAFIISSYSVIQQSIYRIFPQRNRTFILDLASKLDKSVGGYVRAQVLRAAIVGVVLWIIFLIIGVPEAAAIAFVSAFLNPIPYLGPSLATIPAVLSALTVSWQAALATLIACVVIQVLDGNVLQTLLLSQTVSLHPVTVLLSLLAGGALFGFWGILLSIPIAAFLQLLYSDYYLKSKWYLENAPPDRLTTSSVKNPRIKPSTNTSTEGD
jgi:predicted PurR-regulated permease PerM